MTSESERRPDLIEALGGAHGLADSSLPGLAFVVSYTVSGQELQVAIWTAIATAIALTAVRLAKRETLQFAFAGLVGVAIAAFITSRTGRAEDFFLPGLLFNAAYAAAYAISIWVRWPLIGVIAGPLVGEGMEWRREPERVRVYAKASWVWVGVFLLRLAVQLPLYLAGDVVALGIARTAMGVPVFAVAIWLTYLVLRQGGEIGGDKEPAHDEEPAGEEEPARGAR